MRQVDDAHDAEDQRQSAADKKQQRAVGHAVEGLDHPELCIHFPPVPSSFMSKVARSLHEVCRE